MTGGVYCDAFVAVSFICCQLIHDCCHRKAFFEGGGSLLVSENLSDCPFVWHKISAAHCSVVSQNMRVRDGRIDKRMDGQTDKIATPKTAQTLDAWRGKNRTIRYGMQALNNYSHLLHNINNYTVFQKYIQFFSVITSANEDRFLRERDHTLLSGLCYRNSVCRL